MTFHWEFTLGSDRVHELVEQLPFAALGQNIFDAEWDEPAEMFEPYTMFERGGTKIAVIGQAFPYMPIANPGWMFPEYSFGIRDERMQEMVDEVRGRAPNASSCSATTASTWTRRWPRVVSGIDVILSGHTHDALPEPVLVGETILVASGSNGKFVSRVDLDIRDGRMMGYPPQADPDLLGRDRARCRDGRPDRREARALRGHAVRGDRQTDSALYRRGNFNGSWDD
jgi:sulfur-oxidizing protein SoxB